MITTFAGAGVLVCSDELNHASIIDGCRLSRGRVEIARHRDVAHVDELLAAHDGPSIMVTDTATFRNPNYHKFSDATDTVTVPGAGVS